MTTKIRAYSTFSNTHEKLLRFYNLTQYAYDQTENIQRLKKLDRSKIEEVIGNDLIIEHTGRFPIKRNAKYEIRKTLNELVFIRLVTALEIFFIDLIKDAFLVNKEPFKRQDISPSFTQAELLSIRSTAEIYNKIINKECRKLTSGGFTDIVKFYKKYFNVDMGNFSPGLSKMEEYHDRRHLQVHRLGNTDQSYRDKYNYSGHVITIDQDYLIQCFQDFKNFSEMVYNQVNYQLQNEFINKNKKPKNIERKVKVIVEFTNKEKPEFLEKDFEFWCDDEFLMLQDILDELKETDSKCELNISGKLRPIKLYLRIIRNYEKRTKEKVEFLENIKVKEKKEPSPPRVLDENLLDKIKNLLPIQPWPTGIHKTIAAEIQVSNKIVSIAIQQLIAKGVFKPQVNGVIIEYVDDIENK
jgi:hypothetical protein